jgi:preprotein translocase subunit YajC
MFESIAYAMASSPQGEQGGPAAFLVQMIPLILIFVIFYFLLIRPQQKKQKQQRELIEALKKGDKVITTSGIYGTIEYLSQSSVTLRVSPDNVKIKMSRSSIAGVRTPAEGEED